jgi:hypothetical protein
MQTRLLAAHRRAAICHEIIQRPLRLVRVGKIPDFEHFAFVSYHLIDIDRVVLAVVRTIVIDTTDKLVLIG